MRKRHAEKPSSIHDKANKILQGILLALLLILLRIGHLTLLQHETRLESAEKPKRRERIIPAIRATIRDRFNKPLAINRVQYNAALLYSQIKELPRVTIQKDNQGNKVKVSFRKNYIYSLSQFLGTELNLDPGRIEDLIFAKSALYNTIPFVLKEDISEKEYYRLKAREKDFPGLIAQIVPKRVYPKERVASDLLGYVGQINREEYETIMQEMQNLEYRLHTASSLEEFQAFQKRLKTLKERAYSINDTVGKAGIEATFEETLRGFAGKRCYRADAAGEPLKDLPGSHPPVPGQRVLLSISSDLQEFAETLLIQNEAIRRPRVTGLPAGSTIKEPWIKGGAIVAMEPTTGEILALASYPRINPNDFIRSGDKEAAREKEKKIHRWLEDEAYIADIWDEKSSLEREYWNYETASLYEQRKILDWQTYLETLFPKDSSILAKLKEVSTIGEAIKLQRSFFKILAMSGSPQGEELVNALYDTEEHAPFNGAKNISSLKKEEIEKRLLESDYTLEKGVKDMAPYWKDLLHNRDKLLLVDLAHLVAPEELFPDQLLSWVGQLSLEKQKHAASAKVILDETVKKMAREIFQNTEFALWREKNEKAYLKEIRAKEKEKGQYPKPYIDLLDKKEKELFTAFWEQFHSDLLLAFLLGVETKSDPRLDLFYRTLHSWHRELTSGAHRTIEFKAAYNTLTAHLTKLPLSLAKTYLKTLRSYHDLKTPLLAHYQGIRKTQEGSLECHLAAAFYPIRGYGYGRSYAYRQSAQQGSLFKVVTAYEALRQKFHSQDNIPNDPKVLSPFEMIDEYQKNGETAVVGHFLDGSPIQQKYKGGRLIKSLSKGIGRIDLLGALEHSSNPYFGILSTDFIESGEDLAATAAAFSYGERTGVNLPGEIKGKLPIDLQRNKTGLYSFAIGQHAFDATPLQSAVMLASIANRGKILVPKIALLTAGPAKKEKISSFPFQDSLTLLGINTPLFQGLTTDSLENRVYLLPTETKREIWMPKPIRDLLLTGMQRTAIRSTEKSLWALYQLYKKNPEAVADFVSLKGQLVGKTSTAEARGRIDLDMYQGVNTYNHVWFGGISFDQEEGQFEEFTFKDPFGKPELVVVVYLLYGGLGRESAPIAAQIVKKWREIKTLLGEKEGGAFACNF